MSASSFPAELRAEYDAQLYDRAQRRAKARQLQAALREAKLWNSPRRILDVGCGTGLILAELDAPKARRVGCDLRRQVFVSSQSVSFAEANIGELPFKRASFDLVLCLAVIEEVNDWRGALEAMAGCVEKDGILYVTITNGRYLTRAYAVAEALGSPVRASAWHYARHSADIPIKDAARGFDLGALRGWNFVDVTPYLARAAFRLLRASPTPITAGLLSRFTPSFALAWRRPEDNQPVKI